MLDRLIHDAIHSPPPPREQRKLRPARNHFLPSVPIVFRNAIARLVGPGRVERLATTTGRFINGWHDQHVDRGGHRGVRIPPAA